MQIRVSRNIQWLLISLLILLGFSQTLLAFQQEIITSNKNIYKKVVGGAAIGTDFVVVDDLVDFGKFNPGDTVLLMQMKGVQILVPETGTYGDPQNNFGAGKYEFLIVLSTNSGTRTIQFKNNLVNNYNVSYGVQLIWVPSYYSAAVNAPITCPPWDSLTGTGGVLTMIVGKTLKLNANIDVSGKGFIGGFATSGTGICCESSSNNFSYNASFTNSGFKGESIVSLGSAALTPVYPAYAKGRGSNFHGGGGGNGRFSGGGGGAGYGGGGKGGRESSDICIIREDGGLGGKQIRSTPLAGGLFMGGGGGGSTYSGANTATSGGTGGGIIIILCGELDGNGFSILADGSSPLGTASGTAGAGGGGAGGSIAIYLESFSSSTLSLSAKGAAGGSTSSTFGEGGGGGGGLIFTNIAPPGNVTRVVTQGAAGTRSGGGATAGSGSAGDLLNTFVPILNGFLFNTINCSVTKNLIDSICSNNIPAPVLGTKPIGGSGTYNYLWQRRNDSGGSAVNIPASNTQNYTFSVTEADTFDIRRVVADGVTSLTDTSKWVHMIVQPKILNNTVNIFSHIVSLTDTICYDQDPAIIDQVLPDLIVPTTKNMFYKWQDSTALATWGAVLGTSKSYDPPSNLLKTKWYRRTVTSGRCSDSLAKVRVTVLDTISKNAVTNRFDTICHGGTFANLLVDPGLGGGDNTYRYLWQYSTTGAAGSWATASGIATGSTYNPDEASLLFPGKVYFRRKVFSGSHNVCGDSSSPAVAVRLDWAKMTGNTISADEIICSGSTPAGITGILPANGDGTYKFTWQDSSKFHNWTDIAGYVKVTGLNYSPPSLTDTTAYRRIAYSSKCVDTSLIVNKMVHKPITNFNVSLLSVEWDTTICSGSVPKLLDGFLPGASGGTGDPAQNIYQWKLSATKTGGYSDIGGASGEDYQPAALTNATSAPAYFYFRRSVTNGMCSATSDSAVGIKVLPKITNNIIAASQSVCYNTAPAALTGPGLTGGDGTNATWNWQSSIDGGTSWSNTVATEDYNSPPNLTVPTQYRRIVFSGFADCCKDTSNIIGITINPLPVGTITAATDTICEGPGGNPVTISIAGSTASPWTVTYMENATSKPSVQVGVPSSTIQVTPVIANSTTDSASFVYKFVSIVDNLGCQAISLSGARKLVVWKVPAAGAGTDATVCGPVYTLNGTKNVGNGLWFYPGVPLVDSTANQPSFTVTVDSTLAGLQWKYKFLWKVTNWKCVGTDETEITFDRRTSQADAGPDRPDIYSVDFADTLHAVKPLVGTGKWIYPSGVQISNDTALNAVVKSLSPGDNLFEWLVTNGTCSSSDQVTLTVYEFIIPDGFSPNGDGVNDEFEIKGLDMTVSEVTLKILNSAGGEVFFSSNVNGNTWMQWNGESSQGPLPDGTYYYLVTIKSTRTGSVFKRSGFLILKRDKLL
jgi:gliding motility-associated-like protein